MQGKTVALKLEEEVFLKLVELSNQNHLPVSSMAKSLLSKEVMKKFNNTQGVSKTI